MKTVRLLSVAFLVCFCILVMPAKAQTSIAEQQDARVIENLRQAGADIAKVHDIDFFLLFKRKSDAAAAAAEVRTLGYDIAAVKMYSNHKQWEVHAKRKMAPELGAMKAATRKLQALAAARNGYYDGWGTVAIR